jgi:hypothetical protein
MFYSTGSIYESSDMASWSVTAGSPSSELAETSTAADTVTTDASGSTTHIGAETTGAGSATSSAKSTATGNSSSSGNSSSGGMRTVYGVVEDGMSWALTMALLWTVLVGLAGVGTVL